MNAARRSLSRRDWPPYLYEPRPGYYTWRDPRTGESIALGYIPFAAARHQALQANAHVDNSAPTLLQRLTGATKTVAMLLDKMLVAENKNTAKTHRSQDKVIRAKLGMHACMDLSVLHCAEMLEEIVDSGKLRWAQAVRSRLIAVCQRGQELGWMESNPAAVTGTTAVVVKRERLTLESFKAVLAKAPEVAEWLHQAMLIAIVSAQDRDTIAGLERSQVVGSDLVVHRGKTAKHTTPIAIPLELRMDVLGLTLADVLARRTAVISRHVIHHVKPYGNAPTGSPVHPDRISHSFTEARRLAGIPDVLPNGKNAPTFHEIRSLSVRLYKAQGGVDTKALAAHTQDKTHALYQDARGIEAVRVRVK